MKYRYSLTFVTFVLPVFFLHTLTYAEDITGFTYALSYPSRPISLSQFSPYLTVTNLASHSVTVDIVFSAADYRTSALIAVNNEESFELPTTVFLPASNGVTSRTILIHTSGTVSIHGFVAESKEDALMMSSDSLILTNTWDKSIRGTFLALPSNALGNEYLIPAYPREQEDFTSAFTVTAFEDNTAITISFASDTTPPANRRFELQLGESYQVLVKSEVTISTVQSDKPVGVIAVLKSETNRVFLLKQISPTQSFGKSFVVTPFEDGSYDYCIIATEDTTITKCQVKVPSGSSISDCQEEQINGLSCVKDKSVFIKITATNPVAIYQYIKGYSASSSDFVCLAMNIVPPIENYLSDVKYTVIGDGNTAMESYIISDMDTSFDVNGEVQYFDMFRLAQVEDMYVYTSLLSRAGIHTITPSGTTAKFMVIVYGGHHLGSAVTTTPPSDEDSDSGFEGSGSEDEFVVEVTTSAMIDVVQGRYESFFTYPARLKNDLYEASVPNITVNVGTVTASEAHVYWQVAPDVSSDTEYVVQYQLVNLEQCQVTTGQVKSVPPITGGLSSVTLEDLKAYSTYKVTVKGTVPSGQMTSVSSTFQTLQGIPSVRPVGLSLLQILPSSISFTWNPIECGNRKGVVSYRYKVQQEGRYITGGVTQSTVVNAGGLSPSTTYIITVAALTEVGLTGQSSMALSSTTKSDMCPPSYCLNGGRCYSDTETNTGFCVCPNGFEGTICNDIVPGGDGDDVDTSTRAIAISFTTIGSVLTIALIATGFAIYVRILQPRMVAKRLMNLTGTTSTNTMGQDPVILTSPWPFRNSVGRERFMFQGQRV